MSNIQTGAERIAHDLSLLCFLACFFFFQAEDGIRDWSVTGVQTCALPICTVARPVRTSTRRIWSCAPSKPAWASPAPRMTVSPSSSIPWGTRTRSEEHTSELQSLTNLVCRLLLEKKKHERNHRRAPQEPCPEHTDAA